MNSKSAVAGNVVPDIEEYCSKENVIRRSFVQEYKFLENLVAIIVQNGGAVDLSAIKKAQSIMDKYQEQGKLPEPHLESMVSPLMHIVRTKAIESGIESRDILEVIKPLCIIIYTLVTVRGYKTVLKFFPHQVSDMELKRKKIHRYVVFKIDEKKLKQVIVEKIEGPAESYDDFTASLPENDFRYAVYDFDFVTHTNCQKRKIFFIAW